MSAFLSCYIETKIRPSANNVSVMELLQKSKTPIAEYGDLDETIKQYAASNGFQYSLDNNGKLSGDGLASICMDVTTSESKILWDSATKAKFNTNIVNNVFIVNEIELIKGVIMFTCGTKWIAKCSNTVLDDTANKNRIIQDLLKL
jgi:hypothetical protein